MKKLLAPLILGLLTVTNLSAEEAADFWKWFEARSPEFAKFFSYENQVANQDSEEFQKLNDQKVTEVVDELQKVSPELSAFFGFRGGRNKFTITVNGAVQHFAEVDKLIAAAPKLEGWDFIALKQPLLVDPDMEIRAGGTSIRIHEIRYAKFVAPEDPTKLDLLIYLPAKVSEAPDAFAELAGFLTADMLGERLAAEKIREIGAVELTPNSPPDLLPYAEIYKHLSAPEVK